MRKNHQPGRRVVTGHDPGATSVFKLDGPAPRRVTLENAGGMRFIDLWATDGIPSIPVPDRDPTLNLECLTPPPGGSRFRLVEFPAAGQGDLDPAAFLEEAKQKIPGEWNLEIETPGMHMTTTVDYGMVLSGRIVLEVDAGATVELSAGDCVVQNGTRHAWSNPYDEPCWMGFVMIGAVCSRMRSFRGRARIS